MKFAVASAFTLAAFVQTVLGQAAITVNTPSNVVVCQPVLITWSGGTPPYFLSILPGASPTGQALVDFGQQNGTSLTWKANIAAGTSIGLTLRDSKGLVAQSAPFTVNSGTDTTCVGQAVSTSAGAAAPPAPTAPAPPATSAPATTSAPTTGAASGAASGASSATKPAASSSASKPASTTTPNAASPTQISHMGVAGVVGAAVMALLA